MLGVMAGLNFVYFMLTVLLEVGDFASDSLLLSVYVAPVILPIVPFAESFSSSVAFVPIVGALCLVVLPLFWSLVFYGIVRLVRVIRSRMN